MTFLKVLAALFIIAALIALFVSDNIKVIAALIIVGNLLSILDHFNKKA